jgi:hypothetical protein
MLGLGGPQHCEAVWPAQTAHSSPHARAQPAGAAAGWNWPPDTDSGCVSRQTLGRLSLSAQYVGAASWRTLAGGTSAADWLLPAGACSLAPASPAPPPLQIAFSIAIIAIIAQELWPNSGYYTVCSSTVACGTVYWRERRQGRGDGDSGGSGTPPQQLLPQQLASACNAAGSASPAFPPAPPSPLPAPAARPCRPPTPALQPASACLPTTVSTSAAMATPRQPSAFSPPSSTCLPR